MKSVVVLAMVLFSVGAKAQTPGGNTLSPVGLIEVFYRATYLPPVEDGDEGEVKFEPFFRFEAEDHSINIYSATNEDDGQDAFSVSEVPADALDFGLHFTSYDLLDANDPGDYEAEILAESLVGLHAETFDHFEWWLSQSTASHVSSKNTIFLVLNETQSCTTKTFSIGPFARLVKIVKTGLKNTGKGAKKVFKKMKKTPGKKAKVVLKPGMETTGYPIPGGTAKYYYSVNNEGHLVIKRTDIVDGVEKVVHEKNTGMTPDKYFEGAVRLLNAIKEN